MRLKLDITTACNEARWDFITTCCNRVESWSSHSSANGFKARSIVSLNAHRRMKELSWMGGKKKVECLLQHQFIPSPGTFVTSIAMLGRRQDIVALALLTALSLRASFPLLGLGPIAHPDRISIFFVCYFVFFIYISFKSTSTYTSSSKSVYTSFFASALDYPPLLLVCDSICG